MAGHFLQPFWVCVKYILVFTYCQKTSWSHSLFPWPDFTILFVVSSWWDIVTCRDKHMINQKLRVRDYSNPPTIIGGRSATTYYFLDCRKISVTWVFERDKGRIMCESRMEKKDRILIALLMALLVATLLSNIGLIMRDASRCSGPNLTTPRWEEAIMKAFV